MCSEWAMKGLKCVRGEGVKVCAVKGLKCARGEGVKVCAR